MLFHQIKLLHNVILVLLWTHNIWNRSSLKNKIWLFYSNIVLPYNGLFSSRILLFSHELHSTRDIEHNGAVLLHYKDSNNYTE